MAVTDINKNMFAFTDKSPLDDSLITYAHSRFVKSCKLAKNKRVHYECIPPNRPDNISVACSGIHSALNRKYFKLKKSRKNNYRNRTQKQSSSKKEGIRVHRELFEHVRGTRPPRHWMSLALVQFFERRLKHAFIASELPVFIAELNCVTQVDLITLDTATGELHMWELKCGRGASHRNKRPILGHIPNTTFSHWEFQRHFTCLGLMRGGVKIDLRNSHVVNIYRLKKRKTPIITVRKKPSWTRKLPV